MIAKMKCSNCGAEMSNLNLTWGRKHLWFILPIMLIGFLPLIKMTFFKAEATKELKLSDVEKRSAGGESFEIVGLITNSGSRTWSSVSVEAEFFDASGKFIDEAQGSVRSDIGPNAKEHFKMAVKSSTPGVADPATKIVVKIAGGHTMPF